MPSLAWLDPILGTSSKVALLRLLVRRPDLWLTEAEASRQLGLSPNTVNLALRDLRAAGVVESAPGNRPSPVRLSSSPLRPVLQAMFASESKAIDLLRDAVSPLLMADSACILFGSAARGEMRPNSDIDLLLISPTRDRAARLDVEIVRAGRRIIRRDFRSIHLTPGELRAKWETPLLKSIRKDAVPLGHLRLEDFR